MMKRGLRNFFILFFVIVILISNSSYAMAQPQINDHTLDLFNLQFVMWLTWWGNETQEPISPGETREINLEVYYVVTHGAYGRCILQLFKGKLFAIQLFIDDKSDWCEAWITPANITGVIKPDEGQFQHSSLFIHVNDNAPSNFTSGWVIIRGFIEDHKGPFNIFTLIRGYEDDFIVNFYTSP